MVQIKMLEDPNRKSEQALTWGSMDDEREDARRVDRKLRDHARRRARDDYELGLLLRRGFGLRVHELGGFGSFREYAEHVFGFTGRQTEERLRVAEALDRLPGLAVKLAQGELCWSVVRELSRVCTEENELVWIDAAEGRTAREVERMVSGLSAGDGPDTEAPPEAKEHRLSIKVSAATYALWQEAQRALVRETGGSVDEDVLVAMMARRVLEGGSQSDPGRSHYQVALNVCERCRTATMRAGGEHVPVDEVSREVAMCDAQHVGRVDGAQPVRAAQKVPPAVRRSVIARHEHRCAVPGCRHAAFLDVHHTHSRAEGGDHDPERLLPLCPAHHRMAHEGRLIVRGSFSSGFTFEHADGRRYGSPQLDAGRADVLAQVFSALCSMGYKEREARTLIDGARTHVGAELEVPAVLYEVLRQAPVPVAREECAEYRAVERAA
jgi:hypothetical protein